MNKERNRFIQILIILLILGIVTVVYFGAKINSLSATQVPVPTSTPDKFAPSTPAPSEIIYQGDLSNTNWKEFILDGCSATSTPLKYDLELPANWTITKVHKSFDDGNYIMGRNPPGNFSYMAQGSSGQFSIGCMSDGIKGGGCGLQETTFTIDGKTVNACIGNYQGKYHMGTSYIDSTNSKSSTEFWSDGIDQQTINTIFSSFKFQ